MYSATCARAAGLHVSHRGGDRENDIYEVFAGRPANTELIVRAGQDRRLADGESCSPRRPMAWLSWIVARLGGWNCYYKPPGPKTMARGWDKLAAMEGFTLGSSLAKGAGKCANPEGGRRGTQGV